MPGAMASSRGVICALVTAAASASAHAGATVAGTQLRGSSTEPGHVTLRVSSNASFPVTLANCEDNFTVPAIQNHTTNVTVPESRYFWVVPMGVTWDCHTGCPGCFYLALGLERGGGLVVRLGYDAVEREGDRDLANTTNGSHGDEPLEPTGLITGIELVVTQADIGTSASSKCGQEFCAPDWEQDLAVAWSSTMDFIIHGHAIDQTIGSQKSALAIAWRGGGVRWHGPGNGFSAHYHRGVWAPGIHRYPVWRRPVYPALHCFRCIWCCPVFCR